MATQHRERALRSDSLRNRDAILRAAAECLTANPSATLADIAAAAGVARITVYGHFSSRNDLLAALLHTTMAEIEAELSAVDLDGDPWEAMEALARSSWQLVSRVSVLRGIVEQALPAELHDSHGDPRARIEQLLARGRDEGVFRDDQSLAWQSAVYFSVIHGAAAEVRAGRLTEAEVQRGLVATLHALLEV